ncbi:MAG: NAD(P)H-binding protein [Candidatus Dormibacteraeota bacterium]|nr:NAD(P)H-binding protein [Candidatus Dormibacteraeota bacterium]
MNVLVTGGTGTLGRQVVMQLRNSGHRARILSRHPHGHVDTVLGDLVTGAGLAKAVAGMDTVIHAATAATQPTRLRNTDVGGTRRLLTTAREAGVKHFVYPSIVGMDGVKYPYYKYKLEAEAIIQENIVPWSILRATQFHSLMETFLRPFMVLPLIATVPFKWQFQPLDASEVAARLVEVVRQDPAGRLPDFGGPEVRDFKSISRSWLDARKEKKRLVNLPLPFKFSRQFAEGRLLCPDHKDGKITFEQYLADKYTD